MIIEFPILVVWGVLEHHGLLGLKDRLESETHNLLLSAPKYGYEYRTCAIITHSLYFQLALKTLQFLDL